MIEPRCLMVIVKLSVNHSQLGIWESCFLLCQSQVRVSVVNLANSLGVCDAETKGCLSILENIYLCFSY